jgi:AbrB family looped-hinge helix DNA binding protein
MVWGGPVRERRVLKAGHSSIAVTLPKSWAEAMHLRPGDAVVFDQNDDGTLYLRPAPSTGSSHPPQPFSVHAALFPEAGQLERVVAGAYRAGHDAIEIHSDEPLNPERLEELQSAARRLLGLSVVAQDPHRVVLQSFIDPSKYALPQLVQRMKMILIAFVEEAERHLNGEASRPGLRHVSLAEETGKVHALLVRQLLLASRDWSLAKMIGSPDPRQLLVWRVVVQSLDELGSHLDELCRSIGQHPSEFRGHPFARGLAGFKDVLEAVVDALVRPSLPKACEAYDAALELRRQVEDLPVRVSRRGGSENSPGPRGGEALRQAVDKLVGMAEVAVDRAVAGGEPGLSVGAR